MKDIWFGPDGYIDVPSLLDFCSGSAAGWVIHWYDQTINGRHVFKLPSITNSRPKIVSSGIYMGELSFFHSSVGSEGRLLFESEFILRGYPYMTNAVFRKIYQATAMILGRDGGNVQMLRVDGIPTQFSAGNPYGNTFDASECAVITHHNISPTQAEGWANGEYVGSTSTASGQGLGTEGIGVWGGRLSNFTLRELTLFAQALTEQDRQTLERNQGAAWGVNVI